MGKYVVVDLEMCKVPRANRTERFHWASEIIQIGAVLLDESLEVVDTFMSFVAPEYGFIDNYIHELTGISRGDVTNAPSFREAFRTFMEWLPADAAVVSWSNTDKSQIQHEVEGKEIAAEGLEELFANWIDCQKIFGEKMHSNKKYRLSEALVAADILYEDGAHDGLVDAYNTALLFAKMSREPELTLNTYYRQAITGEESASGFTLGNLLQGLDLSALAVA